MKAKEDPRTTSDYNSGDYYSEEEEDDENSSYDSEESSSESSNRREAQKEQVLVVGGCKSCFMYFMVPKQVQECPKCCGQLLHFDRSENGSLWIKFDPHHNIILIFPILFFLILISTYWKPPLCFFFCFLFWKFQCGFANGDKVFTAIFPLFIYLFVCFLNFPFGHMWRAHGSGRDESYSARSEVNGGKVQRIILVMIATCC